MSSDRFNDNVDRKVKTEATRVQRVEVITGVERRRDWTDEQKLSIIAEQPGWGCNRGCSAASRFAASATPNWKTPSSATSPITTGTPSPPSGQKQRTKFSKSSAAFLQLLNESVHSDVPCQAASTRSIVRFATKAAYGWFPAKGSCRGEGGI